MWFRVKAYLNFMGNEFAHPDFIDLPSEANGVKLSFNVSSEEGKALKLRRPVSSLRRS